MKLTLMTEKDLPLSLAEGLRKQVWMHAAYVVAQDPAMQVFVRSLEDVSGDDRDRTGGSFVHQKRKRRNFWRVKTDVLHWFGQPSPWLFLVLLFGGWKKLYVTVTDGEMGKFWTSRWSMLSISLIKRHASKIFVQTQYQYDIAKKYFAPRQLAVVAPLMPYQGVSMAFGDDLTLLPKTTHPRLFFMTHFSRHKGIFELLDSYEQLLQKYPDLELVLANSKIGEKTADEISVLARVEEIRAVGGRIQIKGWIDPVEELSQAWVYVYTFQQAHNTYSVPLSLYESYACGTYFVSSNVGGVSEYFAEDFLVDEVSVDALVAKLGMALDLQKNDGFVADRLLVQDFDNDRVIQQVMQDYVTPVRVFVIANPVPHYAHRAFALSIDANIWVQTYLYKKPFGLIPVLTCWAFVCQFRLLRKVDDFLLVGGVGLFLGKMIKLFRPQKKIVLLNADPFFFDLIHKPRWLQCLYQWLLVSVDGIICNSDLNKSYALHWYAGPIGVVYPGLRDVFLSCLEQELPVRVTRENLRFVYVGRQSPEKNIPLLINYVRSIGRHLTLVGDFDEAFCKKHMSDCIVFVGKKTAEELVAMRGDFDYGFLLSAYDSFGMTPVEFVCMGIVPIISARVGAGDALGEDVVVVDDLSVGGIATCIADLQQLDTDSLLDGMRDRIVLQMGTVSEQGRRFGEVYDSLL